MASQSEMLAYFEERLKACSTKNSDSTYGATQKELSEAVEAVRTRLATYKRSAEAAGLASADGSAAPAAPPPPPPPLPPPPAPAPAAAAAGPVVASVPSAAPVAGTPHLAPEPEEITPETSPPSANSSAKRQRRPKHHVNV